ncbi:MAG: hypothetical protein KGD58_19190, partial [Candidatus Lokiarchaeota archaeon]|nr:hypothetical protein [Candidatus Lokiarchaeota archaeon]
VETFLFKLFINCHKFIFENIKPIFNPSITPHLIYQTEEYNKIEREKEKTSIIQNHLKCKHQLFMWVMSLEEMFLSMQNYYFPYYNMGIQHLH